MMHWRNGQKETISWRRFPTARQGLNAALLQKGLSRAHSSPRGQELQQDPGTETSARKSAVVASPGPPPAECSCRLSTLRRSSRERQEMAYIYTALAEKKKEKINGLKSWIIAVM